MFADSENAKCKKFYSKVKCPKSAGIDAFSQDWTSDRVWIAPPIGLLAKTILRLQNDKVEGTLVLPKWKSSSFWPLLLAENGSFKSFVVDYVEYEKPQGLFESDVKKCVFSNKFPSNVFLLKISS